MGTAGLEGSGVEHVVDELTRLTGGTNLAAALRELKLLHGNLVKLSATSTWKRGGAETYILPFSVESETSIKHFLFKACVGFSLTKESVVELLEDWMKKRRRLDSAGVGTPQLFAVGDGVILEEYIPYLVSDVVAQRDEVAHFLQDAAKCLGLLKRSGFVLERPASNIRSRGNDAVLISFGSDLSGSSNAVSSVASLDELFRVARDAGATLDQKFCASLRSEVALSTGTLH